MNTKKKGLTSFLSTLHGGGGGSRTLDPLVFLLSFGGYPPGFAGVFTQFFPWFPGLLSSVFQESALGATKFLPQQTTWPASVIEKRISFI
jgi:hypothetical protein